MRFRHRYGWVLGFICGLAMLVQSGIAAAQLRTLPTNAQRAQFSGYQNPYVILNNKALRLAPGAVIFDTSNRTITPLALPAAADVVVTTDPSGMVLLMYLLTPAEILRLEQAKR
jgi:hypothetical protein